MLQATRGARSSARFVATVDPTSGSERASMSAFSVVLVTAAPPGQSAEAGGAFVKIDGREALLRSVELFLNRDNVRQVQLVVPADALDRKSTRLNSSHSPRS